MHTLESVAVNPQDKSKGIFASYPDVVRSTMPDLPPDPDNMNDLRAQRADDVLVTYNNGHGFDEEHLEALAGVASNFAHFCDRNGFRITDALELAATFYYEETKGLGRQFSAI